MSYDVVNPILVEAVPNPQGGLELCLPPPLLTRLKEKLQNPCLAVRHVRLSTPAIVEPLVLEFRHPPLAIQFRFELDPDLKSPAELCRRVNQGLSRVLPQGRLLDWNETNQTLEVRLRLEQSLLVDRGPFLDWLVSGGLTVGDLLDAWPEPSRNTQVWTDPRWNPLRSQVGQLLVTQSPLGPRPVGVFNPQGRTIIHLRLLLPAAGSLATIDMSVHPFNAYFRTDPVNLCFQEHLAVKMADLLARPPLLSEQFGVCFSTRVDSAARVVWDGDLPSPLDITLRLKTFWQHYLLPTAVGSLSRVALTQLARFSPRRQEDVSLAATLSPYPNPGQSFFPGPLALCSADLLGDTFLNPRCSYPCLSLIEPSGDQFRLAHAPFLRLEGIEGLGQNISLYLLDGRGKRILPGPQSRVWVELSSF